MRANFDGFGSEILQQSREVFRASKCGKEKQESFFSSFERAYEAKNRWVKH